MGTDEPVIKLGDFRKESVELLTNLLIDLEEHNKEHSAGSFMGKTLGRMLTGVIDDGGEPNMQKAQAEITLETAQGARTGLAEINTKHEKALQRFGLRLAHEAGEGLKHGLPSGPISMKIDNIHTFLRYAQSIPAQTEANGSSDAFKTLLKTVENQIASTNFQHPSPEEKSLLENIEALRGAFERIAPDLDRTRLEQYVKFKDRLEQYLAVERTNLWSQPGQNFGPADWVRDTTPQWLDEKWANAIKILKEQEALGDMGVAEELREHLSMCIKRALEQVSTIQYLADVKETFTEILEKYKKELA